MIEPWKLMETFKLLQKDINGMTLGLICANNYVARIIETMEVGTSYSTSELTSSFSKSLAVFADNLEHFKSHSEEMNRLIGGRHEDE